MYNSTHILENFRFCHSKQQKYQIKKIRQPKNRPSMEGNKNIPLTKFTKHIQIKTHISTNNVRTTRD